MLGAARSSAGRAAVTVFTDFKINHTEIRNRQQALWLRALGFDSSPVITVFSSGRAECQKPEYYSDISHHIVIIKRLLLGGSTYVEGLLNADVLYAFDTHALISYTSDQRPSKVYQRFDPI